MFINTEGTEESLTIQTELIPKHLQWRLQYNEYTLVMLSLLWGRLHDDLLPFWCAVKFTLSRFVRWPRSSSMYIFNNLLQPFGEQRPTSSIISVCVIYSHWRQQQVKNMCNRILRIIQYNTVTECLTSSFSPFWWSVAQWCTQADTLLLNFIIRTYVSSVV